MSLLTGSIEADVPVSFADREWREFVGRSVFDRFPRGYEEYGSSLADIDADDGKGHLRRPWRRAVLGERRAPVHPCADRDSSSEVARAQNELDRYLEKYRDFVLRRCDEELCRSHS